MSKLPNAYWIYEIDKECKHSRRFAALDQGAPLRSIYFERSFKDGVIEGMDKIAISIKEVKEG